MGKQTRKLSALEVGRINEPGKHPVGENLYLQVSQSGTKSWLFRYAVKRKTTWMGLGSTKFITLADARARVIDAQRDLLAGIDPLQKKEKQAESERIEGLKRITFDDCASQFLESHRHSWKNAKHVDQWRNTLSTYASPVLGRILVGDVDTTSVCKVLEPIWHSKTETASRVRGRIERVLSWAAVRGYRSHENPARWRGHLDQILPKRSLVQKPVHFAALPIDELGQFMEKVRACTSISAAALEFAILTATRTSETLEARWSEINFRDRYWLIPSDRMKASKEHKVPLSDRAIEILSKMQVLSQSEFIFPGARPGKPLSNMSLLMLIRQLGYQVTTHGFRSTFRDWCSECTNFSHEVIEMALAHTIGNKVEAAYRRGDLFEKRRILMEVWANFCMRAPGKGVVVSIAARMG